MDIQNMEYVPTLTLDPNTEEKKTSSVDEAVAKAQAEAAKLDISKLSAAEQKAVHDFAEKIDITDTNAILQYGASSQKNISAFSDTTLNAVRTKDMGEVGEKLTDLVVELKGMNFDEEEKRGFLGIRKKMSNHIATLKAQYAKAETNVDQIVESLEKHQIVLLKDVATLDKLYELNQAYFKELTMYILAGKEKLEHCRNEVLPQLRKKAQESNLPEDAQAANDYANMISRFEKKIYDLELTRTISIQMAPQIRLIQNNDSLMIEKIQGSIVNTIPLWKSQMVLALGLSHSQQAMEAQRAVTDVTNELLRRNAERLKTGSIEIAREAERGIVDIETLKHTNENLIATLEEVQTIQTEGAKRRSEAETELARIEGELKAKLLELRK
ncbi:MAG: toxic anion resistance protein [Ruminococcaceae bacterium]|nr:toxic anion resistance protein [Oscillospiraceae bacterium]